MRKNNKLSRKIAVIILTIIAITLIILHLIFRQDIFLFLVMILPALYLPLARILYEPGIRIDEYLFDRMLKREEKENKKKESND